MSLYHTYKIGAKFLVIDSLSIFRVCKPEDALVNEITIVEERIVKGDYSGDEFYGYRAVDAAGVVYWCQWEHFDELATQPYQNWFRLENGEFTELCWELTHVHHYLGSASRNIWSETIGHIPFLESILADLNKRFPTTKIKWCREIQKLVNGKPNTDKSVVHNVWYYEVDDKCFYCANGL